PAAALWRHLRGRLPAIAKDLTRDGGARALETGGDRRRPPAHGQLSLEQAALLQRQLLISSRHATSSPRKKMLHLDSESNLLLAFAVACSTSLPVLRRHPERSEGPCISFLLCLFYLSISAHRSNHANHVSPHDHHRGYASPCLPTFCLLSRRSELGRYRRRQ